MENVPVYRRGIDIVPDTVLYLHLHFDVMATSHYDVESGFFFITLLYVAKFRTHNPISARDKEHVGSPLPTSNTQKDGGLFT